MYRSFGRWSMSSPSVVRPITSERGAEEEVLGDLLNHVHASWLAGVHREHREDLSRKLRTNLVEVLLLHPRAVSKELDRLPAFRIGKFLRIDLVHDQPGHLQPEGGEHLGRA